MRIAKFLTAGGLLTALLVFGFIVSLRSCLSAYDERFALPPVLYFKKGGKEVLFSLVQYNKTTSYSSEQGMVMKTFTNYFFIQTNDGVTGEKILDNKIKERTERRSVIANVIGAANNQAWLYIDGLMAYDPFTLQKIVDAKLIEEKNPLLKGKLPVEIQYYHFNNEDKNIRFTASDGSLWLLNTTSLLATPDELHETVATNIVQKAIQSKLQSLNQTGISFNNMSVNQDTLNGRWFGMYTKEEIAKLDASLFFNTVYAQDARRQLYTTTLGKKEENSFLINKAAIQNMLVNEYFLDAGFLLNRATGTIIHNTNADSRLVIYKNKVGTDAKIMLCCISGNEKIMWRLNTNLAAWTDWTYKGDRVFIMGNNNDNSTGCNVLLIVDLLTGKMNSYDYFADKINQPPEAKRAPHEY